MRVATPNAPAMQGVSGQPMPAAAVVIADTELRILHIAGTVFAQHGYSEQDWPGRPLKDVLPAGSLLELEPRYRAALEGEHQSFDYWSNDRRSAYWVQIAPVRGEDGVVTSVVAVMQDITERTVMIEALSRSNGRLHASERMVGVGSWEWVPEVGALTYSPGFAQLLGLTEGETLDRPSLLALLDQANREILGAATAECLRTGVGACEFQVRRSDGSVRTVAAQAETIDAQNGQPRYLRGAILDVTREREVERERLDAVSLFRQGFDAAPIGMVLSAPEDGCFLRVNDAMCTLLGRSREQLIGASTDSVTHPDDRGGDGRAAMLAGTLSSVQNERRYLRPDGAVIWVTLSVAPVRGSDGTVQAFFSQVVDITERKQREVRFEQDVNDALWLGRIREAIDHERLVLYRQPIVDLRTGETVQQELLLRMRGEDGSVIAPGQFLPIAERYGLISEIDRWVIRQAVELAAQGQPTEFNLSAASIGNADIVRELTFALDRTGADPSLLVVEVTETAMMTQLDTGRRFAQQVTALGCRLALDDFGTGYASLSYLKQIPAQHLKIDIEFVRDLTRSETDERLVRGIIGIAHEFDQTTIAEGIEDQATLVRLRELGVDFGQGYLFGRPEPLAGAGLPSLPTVQEPRSDAPGSDLVGLVRTAFSAFSSRTVDIDTLFRLCGPDVVLRPHGTSERVARTAPYRGHEGLRVYARDVAAVWKGLKLTPTTFRLSDQAVIVFGHVDADSGTQTQTVDALWIWQFRDGLIASIEVFQTPSRRSDGVSVHGMAATR